MTQPPIIIDYVDLRPWEDIAKAPVYLDEEGRVYCEGVVEFDARGTGPSRPIRKQYYYFAKRYLDEKGLAYDISSFYHRDLNAVVLDMSYKGQPSITIEELEEVRDRNRVASVRKYTMALVSKKLPWLMVKRAREQCRR
jgi:hypothetical protein